MNWRGVIPTMTTAFNPEMTVDHVFIPKHARSRVDNGCNGLVALGSLGESATLNFDGKVAILKTLVAELKGKPVLSSWCRRKSAWGANAYAGRASFWPEPSAKPRLRRSGTRWRSGPGFRCLRQIPLILRAKPSIVFLLIVCCGTPRVSGGTFHAGKLAAMDAAIAQAIAARQCPGGVLWVEHNGVAYHKAYGHRAMVPAPEPMTEDTIFDAASLTKVTAGTPAVLLLVERGLVKLDAPVQTYIPEFKGDGKEAITVRQLLTHTSGLRPDIETSSDWQGQGVAVEKACAEKLQSVPGSAFKYSDINFFLLGEIVQRVSRTPLEVFVQREFYGPLKMADTGFLPSKDKVPRIAPTEVVNGTPWRGVVHDPTARHMGGVAGHAGLFTTASDLAQYARMLLNLGELDGVRIFKPETVRLMTGVQTPPKISARRGFGWDIDSSFSGPRGEVFPVGSYGHTGWTGTSIWIDPFSKTFVIFLSNRNHPTEKGSVSSLRHTLGTLAAEAVADFDFSQTPAPRHSATNAVPR